MLPRFLECEPQHKYVLFVSSAVHSGTFRSHQKKCGIDYSFKTRVPQNHDVMFDSVGNFLHQKCQPFHLQTGYSWVTNHKLTGIRYVSMFVLWGSLSVCVCVCVRWVLTLNHDASILQSTNVRKFTSIKHKYSQDVKVVLFHHFPDSDAWWCIIHMCAMMKDTYRNIGLAWLSNPIFIDKPSSWWTNPYGWMGTTCEHSLRFAA